MFCILMDAKTKSFYMDPKELKFYAYSSPEEYEGYYKNAKLVETDMDDYREFMTYLYNAGFIYGYLDGELVRIKKGDVLFYKQNCNEIVYAQYLLTKDDRYLQIIRKNKLYTLCSVDAENNAIYFPTVQLEDNSNAILAYTDISRIPMEMREKYDGWRTVRMTFDAACIVNGKFVAV